MVQMFTQENSWEVSGISSIYSFDMISRDHIIQYTPFYQYYIDLVLIQSLGRISDTNPRLENIGYAPAMMQIYTMSTFANKQNQAKLTTTTNYDKTSFNV